MTAKRTPKQPSRIGNTRRPFPTHTVLQSLVIAQKIKLLNGGRAWPPADVADATGIGRKSANLYYLTASSRDYGITTGTRDTPEIALTELGRSIVYADDPQSESAKKIEAFLNVPLFKQVLEHYGSSALPETRYLSNTLERQFHINPAHHEDFARLFRQNCEELGITAVPSAPEHDAESTEKPIGPATVILGTPKQKAGAKQHKAFVIMPFGEKHGARPNGFFSEVLASLLTPAGVNAGFTVETANRQGSDVIQSTIINDLLEADLVIADLTDHNPNVLFELGVRMAEDKPVALIKATGTGRIFDVDNMLRVYEYNANLWNSTIAQDLPSLTEHIKAAWSNRASEQSYMKILRRGQSPK